MPRDIRGFWWRGQFIVWDATKRSTKKKTEHVSVGFRSWEVSGKFDKDRFCRLVEAGG